MTKKTNFDGTVLIVEDDDAILFVMREVLLAEGLQVRTAKNGLEALETLRSKTKLPSLILLDMFMPVMDGWQFLDQLDLEINRELRGIPIFIVSAGEDRVKNAVERVQGFIRKPINLDLLLDTVMKYCRSKSDT